MSFQKKELWMSKVAGHVTDGYPAFSNPSRIESKRSHHWFVDSVEPELFSSKKQAVHLPSNQPISGASHSHVPEWESSTPFQQVPPQFIDRFGSKAERPVNFTERAIPPVGTDASNMRRKVIDEQFGDDSSVRLSKSHSNADAETCFSYSGIRKIKVNQVKDSPPRIHVGKMGGFHGGNLFNVSTAFPYNRQNETGFIPAGHKEIDNIALMGQLYGEHAQIRSVDSTYCKGDGNVITIADTYGKEDSSIISFGGFNDEPNVIPLNRPVVGNFDKSCHQPSAQITEADVEKQPGASSISATQLAKSRPESPPKNKAETKPSRKEAPNSFPSNVRSLMSTGILDGVPVKYVAVSREELCGIIKGSGYLCGCQSCNYSKGLNAYDFERHSGCKTKHPNNHIYFENGKTIYQIVQELRSTPVSMLFDTIQTAFGEPINQKSFRIWKESFQAATRELQRIYGEELDL